jgi:hypothetical protein
MADPAVNTIELRVLESLNRAPEPIDMDDLITNILDSDSHIRAVDVKIAALDLVSKGEVSLTDSWQLSRAC